MPTEITAILVLLFLFLLLLLPNIKIVGQNQALIVERFGSFLKIIDQPGIHFIIPLLDRVVQSVDLTLQIKHHHYTVKVDEKNSMDVKLTLTYKIRDPKIFVYAALDTLKVILKHLEDVLKPGEIISIEQFEEIKTLAHDFGMDIQKIHFDNL